MAGTIASQVDGVGSAGIWPAAKIVSVRVFSQRGRGATAADYAAAIQRCQHLQHPLGINSINISLGNPETDPYEAAVLQNRVNMARDAGLSVVAATGNAAHNVADVPARLTGVVGVGAVAIDGARCPFSNGDVGLRAVALGCDVRATGFDGLSRAFAGTSYSAPTVAAALTALRSCLPSLTPDAAEGLLAASAHAGPGGPQIDVAAAFRAAGLGALVDAYAPPDVPAAPIAAMPVAVAPATRPVAPASPRVLARSLRGGVQQVRVRVPIGATALFRARGVERRSDAGCFRVRTRRWIKVTALTEDEWGQRSSAVVVRPARRRP